MARQGASKSGSAKLMLSHLSQPQDNDDIGQFSSDDETSSNSIAKPSNKKRKLPLFLKDTVPAPSKKQKQVTQTAKQNISYGTDEKASTLERTKTQLLSQPDDDELSRKKTEILQASQSNSTENPERSLSRAKTQPLEFSLSPESLKRRIPSMPKPQKHFSLPDGDVVFQELTDEQQEERLRGSLGPKTFNTF